MSEATEIVHWPGRDVPMCDRHMKQAKAIGEALGTPISSTPWPAGGICMNCVNEAAKQERKQA